MKLLLQLSLRNLLRHKRRNAMLLVAIAVAVGGVVASNALLRGYQMDLLNSAVSNLTGHVKIYAPGYRDDPSMNHSFPRDVAGEPVLQAQMVRGWAGRVRLPAVIMSERETRGVQLVGMAPDEEVISFIGNVAISGESLADAHDPRILIGAELARQLSTQVGKRLVIITQGVDGRNVERGYRVAGIYDAEGTGLEKMYVFVGLDVLQNSIGTSELTELSVRLTDERYRAQAKRALVRQFAELEVLDWQDLEPVMAQMFIFADATIFIWFLLMMGALTFGLVNSLVAAVMERVRELGMMRALGMQKRTVVLQVIIESVLIMSAGVALGIVLGLAIHLWLADGIDLSAWASGMEMAGMSTLLVPVLLVSDVVLVAVLSILLGFLASLYPAWRVVKPTPLEALRG